MRGFSRMALVAAGLMAGAGAAQAVTVFDVTTGAKVVDLVPNDGLGGSVKGFGLSVAIDGTTALVGARGDDDNGYYSGAAYLFDVTTGAQIAKLTPSDGASEDYFGSSVAIHGTTALVGAMKDDDIGSAYLFDTTTGAQVAKLTPSDGARGDRFGSSVALHGTTALVGAPDDDDNGFGSGSAYLFDTTTGAQIAKLTPSDGARGDRFGSSVALDGTTALVGPWGARVAYLFDVTTGAQLAKLVPNDHPASASFGRRSVALSGTTALVGTSLFALFDSTSTWATTTWVQIAELAPRGNAVALSDMAALVGDPRDGDSKGSAYLINTNFESIKLTPSYPAPIGMFGISVDLDGTNAVVGMAFVPLPAGAWLLISGLGALTLLRRRA